ncbi:MAG TPA: methionyl-tRNA formyltransferase [Casimicrobiaceae bacterium]|nr:methionyl-tRNA formyltransferase [Casimicrobiaceae bacterium]
MAEGFRVGFAGTPPFAATILAAILDGGFDVPLVVTRPDAAQGRGLKLRPSAVKALATSRGLAVVQPPTLRDEKGRSELTAHSLDVLVVAAYGLILPAPLLVWPRHGCINVHASLLPRWRGAAPIQRALLEGDVETGISVMHMDAGLDTGALIAVDPLPISPRETAGSLSEKLAAAGARRIVAVLSQLRKSGRLDEHQQPTTGVSYAPKIGRDEATIDWNASAPAADRRVRALDPSPGATTLLDGETLKIWRAEPATGRFGAPGTIVRAGRDGIVVACGEGALVALELQRAGGKRLSAAAFLAGHRLAAGTRFGAARG